jgi:DinB superfamily
MMNLAPLMERLRRARQRFEAAARRIPGPDWRTPPSEGAWSAAEIVAHVTMVETLMAGAAAKITRKPPVVVPLLKRFHVPVTLVVWRGRRVATPIPLDTLLLDDRDVMLSRLSDQRVRTLATLEAGQERNLRAYRLQHPFLGSLHYYDWFRVLAAHDIRHAKQLHEARNVHKSS